MWNVERLKGSWSVVRLKVEGVEMRCPLGWADLAEAETLSTRPAALRQHHPSTTELANPNTLPPTGSLKLLLYSVTHSDLQF
jgi:hypothetical protein